MENLSFRLLNSTNTNSVHKNREIFSYEEKLAIRISYAIVTCIGIISNCIVSYLIIRNRYLRTIVNLLILNLAISDIIACLSMYPFIYFNMSETSIRGTAANVLCGFTEGLYGFFAAATVSLITLSVLSISRYLGINHPMKVTWKLGYKHMKWVFGLSWALSLVLLIPNVLSFKYNEDLKLCIRNWASGVNPLTYFIFTGLLGVFLPLSSLSFTYFTSLYTLWFKGRLSKNRKKKNSVASESSIILKRRALKLLGVLVLIYLICWSPFATYWLLSVVIGEYSVGNFDDERKSIRITRLTLFFAVSNTVLNPIVYAYTSRQLRSAFKLLIGMRGRAISNSTRRNTLSQPSPNYLIPPQFNMHEISSECSSAVFYNPLAVHELPFDNNNIVRASPKLVAKISQL
ncbi:pyroglutamylated RF-amide peptide receptor isoform X2 [Hydra vulgaris]|uniref:Pyroglutamylated RF-amide peptide receptor isoform X2 n=1 Tax=Hydra vulgaris TaxID=6087 RepID=A0ABM4DJ84_HYDVU